MRLECQPPYSNIRSVTPRVGCSFDSFSSLHHQDFPVSVPPLSTLYRLLFCISNLYSLFSPHNLFPNMRTPSLVCALFATVTVVSGAPFPASGSYSSDVFTVSKPNSPSQPGQDPTVGHAHPRIGIKEIRDALPDHQPQAWTGRTYV